MLLECSTYISILYYQGQWTLLTGLGADGAAGLIKMKEAGAGSIAYDETSCVV
ncbi:MAG: hypothetical protein GY850_34215, partial [bacterium]|nr:hypothetical protein [bacterium]